jgi:hypothetical protein
MQRLRILDGPWFFSRALSRGISVHGGRSPLIGEIVLRQPAPRTRPSRPTLPRHPRPASRPRHPPARERPPELSDNPGPPGARARPARPHDTRRSRRNRRAPRAPPPPNRPGIPENVQRYRETPGSAPTEIRLPPAPSVLELVSARMHGRRLGLADRTLERADEGGRLPSRFRPDALIPHGCANSHGRDLSPVEQPLS